MTNPDIVFRLGEVVQLPPPPPGRSFGRLRVLSVGDARAQPPRAYLVKGLIEAGALSVVYGEPGCGKSFFAQHLAWRIAQGQSAFARRVRQARVLYLALEGESGFATRVAGFAQEYGDTENFHYIGQSLNAYSDAEAIADLQAAAKATGARLIIVDTLARAIAEGDENTAGDMGKLIAVIDALRQATGAHVMLIHHTGKDESRGMRGHSSLNGAADMTLHITTDNETGARQATLKKNKDGPNRDHLTFTLRPIVTGTDEDGDEVKTMVVDELRTAPLAQTKKSRAQQLAAEQRMCLDEIRAFFSDAEMEYEPSARGRVPEPCVTRVQLLDHFRRKEMLGATPGATDRPRVHDRFRAASRTRMGRILNALRARHYLVFNDKHVWLKPN